MLKLDLCLSVIFNGRVGWREAKTVWNQVVFSLCDEKINHCPQGV